MDKNNTCFNETYSLNRPKAYSVFVNSRFFPPFCKISFHEHELFLVQRQAP